MSDSTKTAPLYALESDRSKPAVPKDQWIADFATAPGWTTDSATALFDRMTRAGTLREVNP
jgi:hypothetical protein